MPTNVNFKPDEKLINKNSRISEDERAQLHNAQITNNYKLLENAEADQLKSINQTENLNVENILYGDTAVKEKPLYTNREVVNPPVHTRVDSDLFTVDYLNKAEQLNQNYAEKNQQQYVSDFAPAQTIVAPEEIAVQKEETYTLSSFAIKAIATFVAVVAIMLTVIGINSSIIAGKNMKLKDLETQNYELVEISNGLKDRIEHATSKDTIEAWATEHGMIKRP